jgi:hypothetical protein
MGLFDEKKNRGRKSRDTVPLSYNSASTSGTYTNLRRITPVHNTIYENSITHIGIIQLVWI